MKIALIRHGETALQAAKKYQGSTDEPLSPEGCRKLHAADFQSAEVYVTPLIRTQQTARILFPDARQIVVPELAEMDFGIFEGRSAEEMREDTAYRQWVDSFCLAPCPGGEKKADFCDRVCEAFRELVAQTATAIISAALPDLVIVAHGGVQMAVMERFAEEKKDYWKWMLPSGCGYLLELIPPFNLRVLGILRFTDDED